MRLLHVHGLKLKYFVNEATRPDYAILSHTWGDGEVTFQDLPTPAAKSMPGYTKILRCCEQAIRDGFEYVWIDTCCIDKTSSSELSEAISSMYQWYKDARICYVYLSDVTGVEDPSELMFGATSGDKDSNVSNQGAPISPPSEFSKSRWFTRGWTLQELLAPQFIVFYNCNWAEIGTKNSLGALISKITGIPFAVLSKSKPLGEICVAQRMAWAAIRDTTRVEDMAYCLMGIFDVNMPTLYGEGWKAFIRLQHEIMKDSDDHTLFAWRTPRKEFDDEWMYRIQPDLVFLQKVMSQEGGDSEGSILASSPRDFRYSQKVQQIKYREDSDWVMDPTPYSMTNAGLQICLPFVSNHGSELLKKQGIRQAILNCKLAEGTGPLSLYLKRKPSGQYYRILTSIVCTVDDWEDRRVELHQHLFVKARPGNQLISRPPRGWDLEEYRFNLSSDTSLKMLGQQTDHGRGNGLNTLFALRLKDCPIRFVVEAGAKAPEKIGSDPVLSYAIHAQDFFEDTDTHLDLSPDLQADDWEKEEKEECWDFYFSLFRSRVSLPRPHVNVDRFHNRLPSGQIISVAIRPGPRTVEFFSSYNKPNMQHLHGKTCQVQHFLLSVNVSPSCQPVNDRVVIEPDSPTLTVHLAEQRDSTGTAWILSQNWSPLNSGNIMLWAPAVQATPSDAFDSATVQLRSKCFSESGVIARISICAFRDKFSAQISINEIAGEPARGLESFITSPD